MRLSSRSSVSRGTRLGRGAGLWRSALGAFAVLAAHLASSSSSATPGADLGARPAAEVRAGEEGGAEAQLLRVYVEGMITPGLASRTIEEVRRFLRDDPDIRFVVFQLDTPGGEIDATQRLADFIFSDLKGVRTIAFVPPGRYALSGGALVALAANEIAMGTNTHLGGAAPVALRGVEVVEIVELGEKAQAPVRSMFRRYADERGYSTVLTEAMVTKDHEDILRVRFANPDETRFLLRSDVENLAPEERLRRVGDPQVVLRTGQLLVMNEKEAREYGFAKCIADDLTDIRNALLLPIGDENVLDARTGRLKARFPAAQAIIDVFNQPFPRFLLILGGCLGILVELKTFGLMLPGAFAALCFATFFLASLFPATGRVAATASLAEVLLFLAGAGLVALEIALLPGTAIFAIVGVALCAVSMVLAMVPPPPADPSLDMSVEGAVETLILGLGAGAVSFLALVRFLPHHPAFARRGLVVESAIVGVPTADSARAAEEWARLLMGKTGVAVTPLKPVGKMETDDGRLVDVVAVGEFIEKGSRVVVRECVDGRIRVARADAE